jgi:hypothetical protein
MRPEASSLNLATASSRHTTARRGAILVAIQGMVCKELGYTSACPEEPLAHVPSALE